MAHRSIATMLMLRILLVSNALIVIAIGAGCLFFVERPAGVFLAVGAWVFAGCLFACLPLTDPYREGRSARR